LTTDDQPQGQFTHYGILQKFLMATSQRSVSDPLRLWFLWGFRGWCYFGFAEIQDGGWQPFWKVQTALSPVHFMYIHCTQAILCPRML